MKGLHIVVLGFIVEDSAIVYGTMYLYYNNSKHHVLWQNPMKDMIDDSTINTT